MGHQTPDFVGALRVDSLQAGADGTAPSWISRLLPGPVRYQGRVHEQPRHALAVRRFDRVAGRSELPVLVDFWAPWCGPCKSLGPVLEKVEEAYNGRFKLVKINSDDEQELAGAFGIRSIPTCVLMKDGQPVDGFMGALPEGQVKAFLDKHVPAENELAAEAEEEEALEALADGDVATALAKLQEAVDTDPSNDDARFDLVKLLLQQGLEDEAKVAFAPVIAKSAGVRIGSYAVSTADASVINFGATTVQFDGNLAILDADVLAREVVAPGTDGLAEVVAAFGEDGLVAHVHRLQRRGVEQRREASPAT